MERLVLAHEPGPETRGAGAHVLCGFGTSEGLDSRLRALARASGGGGAYEVARLKGWRSIAYVFLTLPTRLGKSGLRRALAR